MRCFKLGLHHRRIIESHLMIRQTIGFYNVLFYAVVTLMEIALKMLYIVTYTGVA